MTWREPTEPRIGSPAGPVAIGSYEIDGVLGRGGQATVFRAVAVDGRAVAVKVFDDGAGAAAARREAAHLRRVRHPNVVEVVEVVADGPRDALVTTWAAGGSLETRLATRGRLTPAELVGVAAPIADALAAVHGAGLVHGDVSAANIVLTAAGAPQLTDFGAARALDYATADRLDVAALARLCLRVLAGDGGVAEPAEALAVAGRGADLADLLVASLDPASAPSAAGFAAALRRTGPAPVLVPIDPIPRLETDVAGPPTLRFGPRPPRVSPAARAPARRPAVVAVLVGLLVALAGGSTAMGLLGDDPDQAQPPERPAMLCPEPGCAPAPRWDPATATMWRLDQPDVRYRIGLPGDRLLVGDWNCDGGATPGLLRPSTGETFLFDGWASPGRPLDARRGPTLPLDHAGHASAAIERRDGCDALTAGPARLSSR